MYRKMTLRDKVRALLILYRARRYMRAQARAARRAERQAEGRRTA